MPYWNCQVTATPWVTSLASSVAAFGWMRLARTLSAWIEGAGAAATTPVGAEATGALLPPAFTAASTTTSVCPTSDVVGVYAWAVAPAIAAQPFPAWSQVCHWYV